MRKILVVDDDAHSRKLIKLALKEDFEVYEAPSGMAALERIRGIQPDLTILDQRMPDMNGLTTLKKIQALSEDFHCIMVTAEGTLDLAVEALKQGAIDFLTKPLDINLLSHAVKKSLKHVDLIRQNQLIQEQEKRIQEELLHYKNHLEDLVEARTNEAVKALLIAEQANKTQSEFLANMSHELKTPLHAILSFSQLGINLKDPQRSPKNGQYFTTIHQAGQDLLRLLNNLLELSLLEAEKMSYHFQYYPIAELLQQAIDQTRHLWTDKQQTITLRHEEALSTTACLDPKKITHVFIQILANAIRFSPAKSAIVIVLDRRDDHFRITFKDNGPGIPPKELQDIFNKFSQSSQTKTGAGGTGLGLAIAKHIVEDHQGTISAESLPEGGSVFTVQLPKSQPKNTDLPCR